MTAGVAASPEVCRWHLAEHRAAGCPADQPDRTRCPRCDEPVLISCPDCRTVLFVAVTAGSCGTAGFLPHFPEEVAA